MSFFRYLIVAVAFTIAALASAFVLGAVSSPTQTTSVDPWTKLPQQAQRLREAFRQAFGIDPILPSFPVSCTDKSCSFANKTGEEKPGAHFTEPSVYYNDSTKSYFDKWPDGRMPPWKLYNTPKDVVAKATHVLDLGPAWKGAVGRSNLSTVNAILYQGKYYPKGDAGGDLLCSGAVVNAYHTVYGTQSVLTPSEKFSQEVDRLTEFAKSELEQKLRTFAKVAGANGACAPPKQETATSSFNIQIRWRDNEEQAFGDFTLACCLPKQVLVLARDAKNTPVSGAQTQLYFDNVLVDTRETEKDGSVIFELSLPDNLPNGRSKHLLNAQATKNGPPVVKIATVEIARAMSTISVSLGGISGEFSPGDSVPVSGRVWSLQQGLFMDPVKANISVTDIYGINDMIFRASTDDYGFFHVTPVVSTNLRLIDSGDQSFSLEATPLDRNKYEDNEVRFKVKVKSKGQLQVTASTDKVVYDQTDNIGISGSVTAEGQPVSGSVATVLSTGSTATAASNPSGQFSMTMPLAPASSGLGGPFVIPGTNYASIQADAHGYTASLVASAYFAIQELNPSCRLGQIAVANVVGIPSAQLINKTGVPETLRGGSALVQGLTVHTSGSDKVTLAFDLGDGAYATVALNGSTSVKIGRYCQDASGKVTLALKMDTPGQVVVKVNLPAGASPNFQIVTQTASITSVHTRYVVTVDRAGATSVAALDGVVRVGDPNGANSIDVAAGKQISVQRNQAPNKVRVIPISGKVDPALDSLLARAGPPRGNAFPPAGPPSTRSVVPTATAPPPAVLDLTGLWIADNNNRIIYYIRQVGNKVYWNVDGRAVGGSMNVYVGEISGNMLNGMWVDLPQSRFFGTGQLNLRIESNDHLLKAGPSPYGAQEWRRQSTTASASPPSIPSLPPAPPSPASGNLTGAWHLTSNCPWYGDVKAHGTWKATIFLSEAANASLSGSISDDPLKPEVLVDDQGHDWRNSANTPFKSQHAGNTMTLVLHPSGWESVLKLTGPISGSGISGGVVHYGQDDCAFTMTRVVLTK